MKFVREQFMLATTAQNLKRLVFQIVELAERSPSLGRHHEQQNNQHDHHQGCDQRKRAMQRMVVEVASIVCSEM